MYGGRLSSYNSCTFYGLPVKTTSDGTNIWALYLHLNFRGLKQNGNWHPKLEIGKVMNVHKHFMFNFFLDQHAITSLQSDFVSGDSTVNQLVDIYNRQFHNKVHTRRLSLL